MNTDDEQTELSERESRLRLVFDSIDEGYCLCEMIVEDGRPVDYRFLEINAMFEEMTGLSDPIGRTARELVPELEDEWVERYARVGLGGETTRFEQGSDAMGRWFDVFAVPVPPLGRFAIVFRDQSARRAAELALAGSEQRFRTMADQLPMFVWEHGADGRPVWANETMCDFFGLDREAMLHHRWIDLTHPDEGSALAGEFVAALEGHRPFHAQSRVLRHDGEWRWVETWGRPRCDPSGAYAGYLGTSIDVTDRVDGERAVRTSARFLRRVIDNIFAFVGVMTPDGTLVESNRAPLEAAGLELGDVIGRKFWDSHWFSGSPETQTQLRDAVARAANGETVRYDVAIRGVGDAEIWIDFQLAPLRDESGTITHLVPSGHDISERIAAEQRVADALESERRVRRRVELLQRNATHLAAAVTVDDVAVLLLAELEVSLGLSLTALNVLNGEHLTIIAPSKMPDEAIERYQQVHVDADLPGPVAIATNRPVVLLGYDAIAVRFPDVVDAANHLPPIETLAALPLRGATGNAIGALFLASPEAGWLDDTMLDLLTSIAGQTGLALERAQLHQQVLAASEQEHTIALELQRALLPDQLARHPDLSIAARYSAASDLMAVGGDWYDTIAWDDGTIAIMVGDVVGHDLQAATTMGRLRIGVNALSSRSPSSPAAVLEAYDEYGRELGPAFATAACAVIDATTGRLQYSLAGHPAPLVVHPDGSITWLDRFTAPPLGLPRSGPFVATEFELEPGSTVILYSDGLIERRGELIDTGFDRLARSAVRHRAASPDELADRILADLTSGFEVADDVIVVCARWTGSRRDERGT